MSDGPLPKPHGTFTPANALSRRLGKLGFPRFYVRKNTAYSGFKCSWNRAGGYTWLSWSPGDDVPNPRIDAERSAAIAEYEEVLRADGYDVQRTGNTLTVPPKTP